jgi:DNA-binding PadR family transcriptional regulator
LTDHAKRLLTTWLCEQRHAGIEEPKIRDSVLELLKSRQILPVETRMNSALIYLGSRIAQLGDRLSVSDDTGAELLRLLAETESKSSNEIFELFRMLETCGLVETNMHMSGGRFRPSAQGWRELDKFARQLTDSTQVFVAMWFSEQTENAYVEGIEPALRAAGYKPIRIDKKEHNNKIDDEIIAEIRRSRFLIADFTCEPKHVRGGV